MILIACYSWGVAWLELEYWKVSESSHLKNLTLLHNLLGFVLSFLLVFRTNTAYDRWWEGRKIWGSLVNNSRNLAIKLNAFLPMSSPERKWFSEIIGLYVKRLSVHLHDEQTRLALDEQPHPEFIQLLSGKHIPNEIARLMFHRLQQLSEKKQLSDAQLWLINAEVQSFTDNCGACERIKNTPIPYSYSAFLKKFVFFYVMTLPFGFVFSLGYYVIPVVTFIFYVLASLELIAEEIEDPFGADENDLPTTLISQNIASQVRDILSP